jgi:hypothetical protein
MADLIEFLKQLKMSGDDRDSMFVFQIKMLRPVSLLQRDILYMYVIQFALCQRVRNTLILKTL